MYVVKIHTKQRGDQYILRYEAGQKKVLFTENLDDAQWFQDMTVAQKARDTVIERWRKANILRMI
jgi:hypothetical protein